MARLALFAALLATAAGLDFVDLQLAEGTVTGILVKNHSSPIQRYYGVPFAAPPTGANRWQPPQKLAPYGFRQALNYGHSCMQSSNGFTALTDVSEDCLYLNSKKKHFIDSKLLISCFL
jgi:carboxylesterase type B